MAPVVILNMAGGAPRALHPNVIQRNSRWFKFATLKATLETNQDKGEMRACATGFLGLQKRRPTAIFGCADDLQVSELELRQLDATQLYRKDGFARNSAFSRDFRFSCLSHDQLAAEDALAYIQAHDDAVICLNLMACKELCDGPCTQPPPDAQREAEEVIESAVERARPRLAQLQEDVIDRVVDAALALGGRVALTSTRPLSVGEHGASGTRFDECCTTFWCSSVQTLSNSPRAYASALWHAFLKDDQDCRVAGDDFLLTQLADGGTRCTFRAQERLYTAVASKNELLCAYAFDEDRFESNPITLPLEALNLLNAKGVLSPAPAPAIKTMERIRRAKSETLTARTETTAMAPPKPAPPTLAPPKPAPPALQPPPPAEAPQEAPQEAPPAPPQEAPPSVEPPASSAASSAKSAKAQVARKPSSVKQRESQLHQRHR